MSPWLPSAVAELLDLAAAEIVFSSIVAGVVWLVCLALGRRWQALQHALWILVLVRLVLPPGLSHPLGAGALLSRVGWEGIWSSPAQQPGEWDLVAGVPTAGRATTRPIDPVNGLLAIAWLCGVAVLWVRDARGARALRGRLAGAVPVTDRLALRLVERWKRRLGIRRSVRLVTADDAVSPFTFGVLRPVIFIPAALLGQDQRRSLATALSHELAHVARFDVLMLRAERLIARVFFFHPVVWLTSRRLHTLREGLCDALATSRGLLSPRLYVEGLLDLLQLDLQGVEAVSLTPSQRRILMRLDSVLSNSGRHFPQTLPALVVAAALGMFVLPLAGASPPAGPKVAPGVSLQDPLPSGRVTRRFGKSENPMGKGVQDHAGIDLAAAHGTPVLAAEAGTVELAVAEYEAQPAAGTVVIIDHGNGSKTFYSHLSSLGVKAGQKVTAGQILGAVGNTGASTGPHLHFEVWKGEEHVDPAKAIPALAKR